MMSLSSLVPSIFAGSSSSSPPVDKNGRPLKEFKEQPRELCSGSYAVFQDDMLQEVIKHQQQVAQQVYEKERHDTLAMLPDMKKLTRNSIQLVSDAVVSHHHSQLEENNNEHHHHHHLKEYSAKPRRCTPSQQQQQGDILVHAMERRRRTASLIAEGKQPYHHHNVIISAEEFEKEERQERSLELADVSSHR